MPEGDTVFRTARRLHEALAGEEVTRFDIRVPRHATADLTGEVVHEVVPRGKHLLMRIGEYTLHSHLKMEGRWLVFRPGERWRSPAFQARALSDIAGTVSPASRAVRAKSPGNWPVPARSPTASPARGLAVMALPRDAAL